MPKFCPKCGFVMNLKGRCMNCSYQEKTVKKYDYSKEVILKDVSGNKCVKCAYLMELYERTPKSNRDYWLMTELFVMLHDSDVCIGTS